MSDKILSAENVDNLLWLCGASDRSESAARIRTSHAAQAERIEELKAAVIRRSGSSSWQEWTGIWDPTEETAVEATKRLFQRIKELEQQIGRMTQAADVTANLTDRTQDERDAAIQRAVVAEAQVRQAEANAKEFLEIYGEYVRGAPEENRALNLLRQIREVLPAERARGIASYYHYLLSNGEAHKALYIYAALIESTASTLPAPTWQQQAEQEAADFFEKDGHRWVRMTSEEEAAKRLAESLV